MAYIVLGCDSNGVNDAGCRDTVARILTNAGHKVEKLAIAPGPFASYSYQTKAKGKIGIYLIAAGTNSISDLYYGGTYFDYAYFGIRGDISSQPAGREPGFSTRPIGKDPDCSSYCNKIAGLTFAQMNNKLKDRLQIVGGSSPEEIGNNLVSAIGGGGGTAGGSSSSSSSASKDSSVSPLLQGDMTFEELVGEICNGIDLLFLPKRTTIVVDDFQSIYAEAKYLREHNNKLVKDENVNLWQLEEDSYEMEVNQHGFYNTVYVQYKNGTVMESFDDLVRVYGKIPITYKDYKADKTTAQMKAKAYLAAHVRDFDMSINLTMLTNPEIDIGDIITVENPKSYTNHIRISKNRDPEYLFVNGINTNWEGESYLSSDLELKYAPVSPEKLDVPASGTATGTNADGSSNSNTGTMVFDSCGVSNDKKYLLSICRPSGGRSSGYSYGSFYITLFDNKCPRCGRSGILKWDSGTSQTHCITCGGYSGSKRTWGDISEGEVSCNGCCSDFDGVTGWEKDGGFSSRLTYARKPVKASKADFNKLLAGNYSY